MGKTISNLALTSKLDKNQGETATQEVPTVRVLSVILKITGLDAAHIFHLCLSSCTSKKCNKSTAAAVLHCQIYIPNFISACTRS